MSTSNYKIKTRSSLKSSKLLIDKLIKLSAIKALSSEDIYLKIANVENELSNIYNEYVTEKGNCFFVYTDGSCIGRQNERKGGCGVYIKSSDGNTKSISIPLPKEYGNPTNNKSELYAIIAAFSYLKTQNVTKSLINLVSDSMYCINSMSKWYSNWEKNGFKNSKGEEVKNVKLLMEAKESIDSVISDQNEVSYIFVKSHNKDKTNIHNFGNNKADNLAVLGAKNNKNYAL